MKKEARNTIILIVSLLCLVLLFSVMNYARLQDVCKTDTRTESQSNLSRWFWSRPPPPKNNYPIVLVHGLFGYGQKEKVFGIDYWFGPLGMDYQFGKYGFNTPDNNIIRLDVGPISSFHDRACEAYAQLKGVRTDYGAAHSTKCGHNRYGKDYSNEPKYSNWSASNPIHMVGHSAGGFTILKLIELLDNDFWGHGTSASWVKSSSGISAVYNGSTAVYQLGADKKTGEFKTDGAIAGLITLIDAILATANILYPKLFDFQLEHWSDYNRWTESNSLKDFLLNADFIRSQDNLAYDLSLQGTAEITKTYKTHPNIYYFTYQTDETYRKPFSDDWAPDLTMNPLFRPFSSYVGKFDMGVLEGVPGIGTESIMESKNWRENDGLVPKISMNQPFLNNSSTVGEYSLPSKVSDSHSPGRWYVESVPDVDHLEVIFLGAGKYSHTKFYYELFERLAYLQ